MAPLQKGLNQSGNTANFSIFYDDSLSTNTKVMAVVIANANALIGVVENEFKVTTGPTWFNSPFNKPFGTSNPQKVFLNGRPGSGAGNNGYGSEIHVDAQGITGDPNTTLKVEDMFMAEGSEILISIIDNWHANDSSGEGLSQFSTILRFPNGRIDYFPYSFTENWLNGGNAYTINLNTYVSSSPQHQSV
jgi:hypothetical protein